MATATSGVRPIRQAPPPNTWIERHFHVWARGSTIGTEIRGGLSTFLVMAYIIFVNPSILALGATLSGQPLSTEALVTSTCVVAFVCTLLMGLRANLPFAIAPGMGLNAVVAFQLMVGLHYTFAEAMSVILVEGVLITILVLLGLRQWIVRSLPAELKYAIGAGIGLFLLAIGAYEAGFFTVPLAATQGGTVAPPTAGVLGNLASPPVFLALFGLIIMGMLMKLRVHGALLIGILLTTVVGIVLQTVLGWSFSSIPGKLVMPASIVSAPNFALFGAGLLGFSFFTKGLLVACLAVLSVMLSDFFDTAGTFAALGAEANLADAGGNLRENEQDAFMVDSVSAAMGGLLGSSSATTYIESGAGIAEGARTGLASVVTSIPFLLAMVFAPLVGIIPQEATAGALIIVGVLMLEAVGNKIPWNDRSVSLPIVMVLAAMMLTWSITNGIGAGLVLYTILNPRRASVPIWIVTIAFVMYFIYGLK